MTYMKEIPFQNGAGPSKAKLVSKDATTVNSCGLCGMEAVFLCSGCRRVMFCSFQCQQKMWKEHKRYCQGVAPRPCPAEVWVPDAAWVMVFNTDALPGHDAGTVTTGPEAAKEVCVKKGFGGMVLWQNRTFFLRKEPVAELVAAMCHAQGTHLWLPAAPLRSLAAGAGAPPRELPPVVLDAAKPVRKCCGLTVAEMDANFHNSTPVVLTDAQDGWPAREKWTFDWLAQRYGDEMMPCSDLAPFFRHVDRGQIRTVNAPLSDFVRYVQGKPSVFHALQQQKDRVFYANGWAPFLERPELLLDVSDRLYCVSDSVPKGGAAEVFNASLTKIFMGPAGTISRLHHDTYATHVWLSQIRGRKQFICYPPEDTENLHSLPVDEVDGRTSLFDPERPDFLRFPDARKAQAYSVVVEEGETVVLPARWWHWAKSLTPSITLMRNFVNKTNLQDHIAIRQRAEKLKAANAAKA